MNARNEVKPVAKQPDRRGELQSTEQLYKVYSTKRIPAQHDGT